MRNLICLLAVALFPFVSIAGGNPEFVLFPADYKSEFTHYHSQNRANNKQVAEFYANNKAIESYKNGQLMDGSIVVMEVYKPELDSDGQPVQGENGLFVKSSLAAVAVMEKKQNWDTAFPAEDRTGNWGYAIYTASGEIKENNLECAACHMPLENSDYMFTYEYLSK